MRAISLWQPWASLIVDGRKGYETRHWATKHRGPLAIHAAKQIESHDCGRFSYPVATIARGAVLGVVALEDCIEMTAEIVRLMRNNPAEFNAGNWMVGRFAWRLRLVEKFPEPIPAIGRQGLFEWNP